jgi:hypothetical protein
MPEPQTLEARRSSPPTDRLAAAWLAGYSSPKTRRTYQTMIRSWFDWCALCGLEPLSARRAHVELWQRALEQHGYAVRTIALKLTAVASLYRYCEQEDLLARTPMACVRRPRVERLSPRGALTRGQVHDLLAGASASVSIPTACAACWPSTVSGSPRPPASTSRTSTTRGCTRCCASPARAGAPPRRSWPGPPKPPYRSASVIGHRVPCS